MYETLTKLLPVFLGFAIAFTVKTLGWVKPAHGRVLLKLSFYVTIPALIFVSVSQVGFTRHLLVFPALPYIVVAISYVVTRFIARRMHQPWATEGTFRVAPLTISSAFTLPFLVAAFGGEGATRVALFNAGFNPLLLLGVYGLAASYNPGNKRRRDVAKRILILPPLWALAAGLLVNVSGAQVAAPVMDGLQAIGSLTSLLAIAALGVLFNPQRIHFDKTMGILGLRVGLGLAVGILAVGLFHLHGIDRAAALALAAAPIGFNLLTFAAVEKLDEELAASAVSLSILAGLILIPAIILLAG